MPDIMRDFSDETYVFNEMIRYGDRAESTRAEKIHELRDREFAVAECRMEVKIREKHLLMIQEKFFFCSKKEGPSKGCNSCLDALEAHRGEKSDEMGVPERDYYSV